MSSEAVVLLAEIRDELRAIRCILEAPKANRRKHSKRAKLDASLAQQGRAQAVSPEVIQTVLQLWTEICPDCAPVVAMNDERRLKIASLWQQMGGEDGVRNVFLTVAGNDWLCGRLIKTRGIQRRSAVGLFEVIDHLPEVIEQTYR